MSWRESLSMVATFAFIDVIVSLYTACRGGGLYISGCGTGQVFLVLLSMWILLVFLIFCGLIKFLSSKVIKSLGPAGFNNWVFILALIFSLLFLIMMLASMFGSDDGGWFLRFLNDLPVMIAIFFLSPILFVLKLIGV